MEFPITATKYDYVNVFVNTIAPMVVNEYLARKDRNNKVLLPSVVIAMACQESGYNLNASTLFGIKGEGFYAPTKEYIDGVETSIIDSFKCFPTIGEAIVGLYDLMQWAHYDRATEAYGYISQCVELQHCGYATDPKYAASLTSIISDYNLSVFDEYADYMLRSKVIADDEESGDVEPTIDNTESDEADSYIVQAGDNLWQIVARRYQLDDNAEIYRKEMEIAALNNIDDPSLIYAGMVINFN